MSVYGIALVKDEADIIERSVLHMAAQVDHLIVSDNGSTDGTRDLLADLAHIVPLTVTDDTETAHYQSRKLTELAVLAGEMGATWVVPFDADELVSSPNGRLADVMRAYKRTWIFTAQLYDHVPTSHDDQGEPDPVGRIGWRKSAPNPLLKIAARTHPDLLIEEGSHTCHYNRTYPRTSAGEILIRHFPYRSAEQFIRKARNGARGRNATDLPSSVGAHLRGYGQILDTEGPEALEQMFYEKFWVEAPTADHSLIFDPA